MTPSPTNGDATYGVHHFADHIDQILHPPTRGEPRLDWVIGVRSDGTLLRDSWDDNRPHLLISGRSGAGKSNLTHSFLCQVMHNNHPEDVQIWVAEAKNELQPYRHLASVARFIDRAVTSASPYVAFAAMLQEARNEVERRRAVSRRPGDDLPRIFVLVSECAEYLLNPAPMTAEDERACDELLLAICDLAERACGTGVHLILETQYPVKRNIPSEALQRCRRIGLAMADGHGSVVAIGERGLEEIMEPGRGMHTTTEGLVTFRSLLLAHSINRAEYLHGIIKRLPADTRIRAKLPTGLGEAA